MSIATPFQGSLFANDFLRDEVTRLDDWRDISDDAIAILEASMRDVFDGFPIAGSPNESQTEDDLIWPVLLQLGWTASLRQQNLSAQGREDVPDGLLFRDAAAKDLANGFPEGWKRYEFGLAVVESKRWLRPLDRRSGRRGEENAPSTQMLRYLRRVDDLTTGKLRWGILTNGARWRLYYQGVRSVSEQFFEVDLAVLLNLPGHNDGLFALTEAERHHWLKVFVLVFRREAFVAGPADPRTFHQRAIEEGRFYEKRVAASLSNLVFGRVFPGLARAIAAAAPQAPLPEVREAALILLYRLLFILYAEDRNLLPVRSTGYDDYALREKVRGDVGQRKDRDDVFSATAARYWSSIDDLCRAIDQGDASIGLPPYNGGLFDRNRTPLLGRIRIPDQIIADVIDALSFVQTPDGRRYINYRDLGVQQLGSIYERLLEHEIVRERGEISVRPNVFARKGSGSYYTPDDLVGLIIKETIEPLVRSRMDAFTTRISEIATTSLPEDRRIGRLKRLDPAEKLLELKVCDPAMGSGHFLVNLVDYLADRVIAAIAEAEALVDNYVSPLTDRIDMIRNTIIDNAEERGWAIDLEQLDDRHIVRRMVLKRCVYGVDKNPMAVELSKVALWLHTFTVGAPLSFLDHHLRCGDSLFGSWVRTGIDKATAQASPLFLEGPLKRAKRAAAPMQIIEGLSDAEIAETHRSAEVFAEIEAMTTPLNAFLSLVHAFDWLNIRDRDDKESLYAYFLGIFGDPIDIASGKIKVNTKEPEGKRFAGLFDKARLLLDEERFFNWQVAFPGVWSEWESDRLRGGFDAIIGNPPWDRMKLQQVEWFAARRAEIAHAQRAADRKRMIAALRDDRTLLASEFERANERAESAARVARTSGDYPHLSRGDVNIYSLFVERAMALVAPGGMVGLLTPIGIATDKTSAPFFAERIRACSVKAFLAFENRRGWLFPDIHHEEQPSIFVFAPTQNQFSDFEFCVRISSWEQFKNSNRRFQVSANLLREVNPNTKTVPMFRTRRDAELTTAIYRRLPVLVDRSSGSEVMTWPVKYTRMFDMTNDSHLFRTREELEEQEGAYPIGGNRFFSTSGEWVPLYEGKMVQICNHRYASVRINPKSISGQGVTDKTLPAKLQDPAFIPHPRYWVNSKHIPEDCRGGWRIGFNDICNTNNARSLIACIVPDAGFGNKLPILSREKGAPDLDLALLVANLCALVCDYVARQKIQSRNLNKYILEQLPVVPPDRYKAVHFGRKTASEIVRESVLELTYTAHDMAPFARDMGHVDELGEVKPPFIWDGERRLYLRAKLDAVFFHLYGVTDRDDIRYIFSTFPTVERKEKAAYGGVYRSRELCLAWMNALTAGDPDAEIYL
ncbi:MAG: hypothetical protein OXL36_04445 [Bryobacterales bacterium]|nr:hypothetical protein [Bryobacterales bacterium]MDE0292782.1 hypothetical protein [Bryobacterales bacterium]